MVPLEEVELRLAGGRVLIAYRLNRSFALERSPSPRLPPRPRQLPPATVNLFDRTLEGPVGNRRRPAADAKWIAAYARLATVS